MRKLVVIFLFSLCALPSFCEDKKHNLEVAFETQGYKYREPHMQYPISLSGSMIGVSGAYTQRGLLEEWLQDDSVFFSLEARYMAGRVDYEGYFWDGTPTKSNDIGDYYIEGRLLLGQAYRWGDYWRLEPYLGIGYRRLRDHSNNGEGGYFRQSEYTYLPLGANLRWDLGNTFYMRLNGEWDVLLSGEQYSRLSDVPGGGLGNATASQDTGYGLRASLRVGVEVNHHGIFVEPYYRYWHIQNSNIGWAEIIGSGGWYQGTIEPFNITREWGCKIGITF